MNEAQRRTTILPFPISGVIVAGGRSQRMGHDKRRLQLWGDDGPTLLEHTVLLVRRLCDDVVVVVNDPDAWSHLPARIVGDVYPDGGALGGIYSGLIAAHHGYAFVVAADMPLLNAPLVRWMIRQPREYNVLVPQAVFGSRTRNRVGVESLHAIYSRACLVPMQQQLNSSNLQVSGFFDQVRVRIIEGTTLRQFDPDQTAFTNLNTPADVELVQAMILAGSGKHSP